MAFFKFLKPCANTDEIWSKRERELQGQPPYPKKKPKRSSARSHAPEKADAAHNFDARAGNLGVLQWPDAIFIEVRDGLRDDARKIRNEWEELRALSIIPGPYFKLPFTHCHRPVYKQASSACQFPVRDKVLASTSHNPAYIFFYNNDHQRANKADSAEVGWWCSSKFWETLEERDQSGAELFMRMWHGDEKTWARDSFCCPHWADKAALTGDIKMYNYIEYLEVELEARVRVCACLRACLRACARVWTVLRVNDRLAW